MREDIRIDTAEPLPPPRQRGTTVYPWGEMEPGDSFFVALDSNTPQTTLQRRVLSSARAWSARHPGQRFTTRRLVDNGVVGVRCWRVS